MPIDHYENFPVASVLLPAGLRKPVEVIYRFARTADDFADEDTRPDQERLMLLASYGDELRMIARGERSRVPLFQALGEVIRTHQLPVQLFHDLLSAFTQDVTKKRYANYSEVLDYSRRSANPVGRLLLALYKAATPQHLRWSDNICSALQIINFLQDIAIDHANGRIYMPQDEMARFGVTEQAIAARTVNDAWHNFMAFQINRTRRLLLDDPGALDQEHEGRRAAVHDRDFRALDLDQRVVDFLFQLLDVSQRRHFAGAGFLRHLEKVVRDVEGSEDRYFFVAE